MKLKYASFFLVQGLFTSSVSYAGWECTQGQPQACINQVNQWNENFRAEINTLQSEINGSSRDMNSCWASRDQARSDLKQSEKDLENTRGRFEEVKSSYNFMLNLVVEQRRQVAIISSFQNEFHSYFREIVLALRADINANVLVTTKNLQDAFSVELNTATDKSTKTMLTLAVSMIDEIKSFIRLKARQDSNLLNKLSQASYSSETSALVKAAVDGAISTENIAQLNLHQKLAGAVVQANAVLSSVSQKKEELSKSWDVLQAKIKSLKSDVSYYTNKIESKTDYCNRRQNYYSSLPAKLQEAQTSLNTNLNYLAQEGCRSQHCRFERTGREN